MEIKNIAITEKKNVSAYVLDRIGSIINGHTGNLMSPSQAYWLWANSDTVGDACDRISWAFEQLEPVLKDKKTNEYITDHPLIELINNPGFKQTSDQFQFEYMTSYLVAGEAFPILEGNVKFEPFGLWTTKACDTTMLRGSDGWLEQIISIANERQKLYSRVQEKKRGIWVYQDQTRLEETVQIKNITRKGDIRGQSVLERVYYQALTKYYGNVHNSGMLKNAGTPSGIVSSGTPLTQSLYEAFKKEVYESMTGPANAGRLIAAPTSVNYENLILNPRDMDFIKLIENSRVEIYNQYQIPLPLVTTETMTLGNYENAVSAFYDMSVMPRARFLYKQLGKFALPRYKDGDRYELVVNEKEIPALKERLFKIIKIMRESSVFSENEMRDVAGYESLGDEGEAIWKPVGLVQSGETDEYTLDNIRRRENEEA
jgi:HK97 family phage portal protein